jgi:hypothetical protein
MTSYEDICEASKRGQLKYMSFKEESYKAFEKMNLSLTEYMGIPRENISYYKFKDGVAIQVFNPEEAIQFNNDENIYGYALVINVPDEKPLIKSYELLIHVKFKFIKENQWQIKIENAFEEKIDINDSKEMKNLLDKLTLKTKEFFDFNPEDFSNKAIGQKTEKIGF